MSDISTGMISEFENERRKLSNPSVVKLIEAIEANEADFAEIKKVIRNTVKEDSPIYSRAPTTQRGDDTNLLEYLLTQVMRPVDSYELAAEQIHLARNGDPHANERARRILEILHKSEI